MYRNNRYSRQVLQKEGKQDFGRFYDLSRITKVVSGNSLPTILKHQALCTALTNDLRMLAFLPHKSSYSQNRRKSFLKIMHCPLDFSFVTYLRQMKSSHKRILEAIGHSGALTKNNHLGALPDQCKRNTHT